MWRNTNWYQRVNLTPQKTKIFVVRPPTHAGQVFFASEQFKIIDGKPVYRTEHNQGTFQKRFMPEKYARYYGQVIAVDIKMFRDINEYDIFGSGHSTKESFLDSFTRQFAFVKENSFCWMIKYRRLSMDRAVSLEERRLKNVPV